MKSKSDNNCNTGKKGENIAEKFLTNQGMVTIRRNYRNQIGEIDIITRDGDELVFVEVKTVTTDRFALPLEQVNLRKQKQVAKVAEVYLSEHPMEETADPFPIKSCRFDVVGVSIIKGRETVQHIKDAFIL